MACVTSQGKLLPVCFHTRDTGCFRCKITSVDRQGAKPARNVYLASRVHGRPNSTPALARLGHGAEAPPCGVRGAHPMTVTWSCRCGSSPKLTGARPRQNSSLSTVSMAAPHGQWFRVLQGSFMHCARQPFPTLGVSAQSALYCPSARHTALAARATECAPHDNNRVPGTHLCRTRCRPRARWRRTWCPSLAA